MQSPPSVESQGRNRPRPITQRDPAMIVNPSSKYRTAHRGMRLLYSTDTLTRCQEESIGRPGLSRVDLLAILGCIVAALVLFLPQLVANRDQARQGTCAARQFRTALAIQTFDDEFQALPGYRLDQLSAPQSPAISWAFPTLPYLIPLSSSILLGSSTGDREVEGNEPFDRREDETIRFRSTNYLEIFTLYGSSGPPQTQGKVPEAVIVELQCPAVWLEVRDDSRVPRNFMSWRVASGLPDQPQASPPDHPETAVWVDSTHPQQTPTRLQQIEGWDGVSYTVLFGETTRGIAWPSSEEAQVGLVAGWSTASNASESSSEPASPSDTAREAWTWAGVESEVGATRSSPWDRAGSYHASGINVAFCDASIREIERDIEPRIWAELLMPRQAEARFPGTDQLIEPRLP